MRYSLTGIRDRFHPLNHLRRHAFSRRVLSVIDVPIWAKLPGVDWKVRVRFVRHASVFMLPGGVEPGILALFRTIQNQIGIRSFWDVGTNIGYYSWLTKSIEPKAKVRMFEPEADNVTLICETLRRTSLREIVVRDVAVSDTFGQQCFVRDEVSGSTGGIAEGSTATFSQRHWNVAGSVHAVDTVSLDEERAHSAPVDLIKIDVEGHEEAVLRGARKLIREDQPTLIFECFHGGNEITAFLRSLGYWIGNAESPDDDLKNASNFLALPATHRAKLDTLKKCWTEQMSPTTFKAL
jgi:FkbM family methyltransferase